MTLVEPEDRLNILNALVEREVRARAEPPFKMIDFGELANWTPEDEEVLRAEMELSVWMEGRPWPSATRCNGTDSACRD